MVKKVKPLKVEFTLTVVGLQYRMTMSGLELLKEMADRNPFPCKLEREPENEHDPNAIKVVIDDDGRYDGMHVGYIQRGSAAKLATRIDHGAKIVEAELYDVDLERDTAKLDMTMAIPKRTVKV